MTKLSLPQHLPSPARTNQHPLTVSSKKWHIGSLNETPWHWHSRQRSLRLYLCCPLPSPCKNFIFHFTLTCAQQGCVGSPCINQQHIQPPWPARPPDQCHTSPSDSSVQGKWAFVPYQGRTVHWFPLYTSEVAMLIARLKCQRSNLPARALRKSLDVTSAAQLSRGLL